MSPRWNWDSPTPLAASECALPPGPKGGGAHSPAAKGVGESQFQRLEKRLALCLLCGFSFSIDKILIGSEKDDRKIKAIRGIFKYPALISLRGHHCHGLSKS